jgi:uncharacterized protein YecT (DUF1311 family)
MPQNHILPALVLLCCCSLARAQFTGPNPAPKPPEPPPHLVLIPNPTHTLASPYADPCEANAATVNFDSCYADQFKLADQDVNRLYRNAILAFESDIADAHKRSDQGQLRYDSTALFDLKSAQDAWTHYRDLQCHAAGQQFQGGSIQPIVVNKCLILVTLHRIDEIRAAYEIGGRSLEDVPSNAPSNAPSNLPANVPSNPPPNAPSASD